MQNSQSVNYLKLINLIVYPRLAFSYHQRGSACQKARTYSKLQLPIDGIQFFRDKKATKKTNICCVPRPEKNYWSSFN